MAFTLTVIQDGQCVQGNNKTSIVDVAISGSYQAGGYTINAGDVGLKSFKAIDIVGGDVSQLTYYPFFDFGAAGGGVEWNAVKIRLGTATGTEATGSLSPAVNLRFKAEGY
jgi:hypothetical protein